MKTMLLLLFVYWGSVWLHAQEKPFEEAMPDTGTSSPEERAKLNFLYEKMVRESREYRENFVPPDYSKRTTTDLLETALQYHNPDALEFPYIKAELKKRPKELMNAIYKQIATPKPE